MGPSLTSRAGAVPLAFGAYLSICRFCTALDSKPKTCAVKGSVTVKAKPGQPTVGYMPRLKNLMCYNAIMHASWSRQSGVAVWHRFLHIFGCGSHGYGFCII
jgi:hypothetical protein